VLQELCCELASLQCEQMVPLLTLQQLAHTVWRLQLCTDLERSIKEFSQVKHVIRVRLFFVSDCCFFVLGL
jgi:hypothetical protein